MFHPLVLLNLTARGYDGQHEDDLTAPFWIAFEEALVAAQSMQKAFGVVEAIDREDDLLTPQAHLELLTQLDNLFGTSSIHEALKVDTDGKCLRPPELRAEGNFTEVVLEAQRSKHRAQEVLRVVVGVKADQVRAQHSFQQLASPARGQVPKDFEARKRDVQKEPNLYVHRALSQHLRQQQ